MYAVAITRHPEAASDNIKILATLVGADAYDMRMRLAGPLPIVVAYASDADQGSTWLRSLRGLGYGSVACDLERVPTGQAVLPARAFELEADAIAVRCEDGRTTRVQYTDVLALIHTMLTTDTEALTSTTEKKLSVGRALVTSGLSIRKTTTTESRSQIAEHEPALYIVRKTGSEPVVLRQNSMQYDGLGPPLPSTRLACFAQLITRLRAAAPDALFDNRLLSQKRRASSMDQLRDQTVSGGTQRTTQTITQSNAGATELAVHLIAVAHLRGQL